MLKRIYIDNFRCLVNFELAVDPINLFLGPNGAGKSSVFDVLRAIQTFVTSANQSPRIFTGDDLTRWQTSPVQRFELEIEGNEGVYKYELGLTYTQQRERQQAQVMHERLWFNNDPVLRFESGNVQLYRDDGAEGQRFSFGTNQSVLAIQSSRPEYTRLNWFIERMKRFLIVRINPIMMTGESRQEEMQPSYTMENFASWYRYIYQDQGKAITITNALKDVLNGFSHFKFDMAGQQHRLLKLYFSRDSGSPLEFRLDELSDGERALIALYMLIYYARSEDYTLCIDEPENFLALAEIQPWLTLLYDVCGDGELQALLISHHPELINYLATSAGYWFERESGTPVRVKRITEDDSGVSIAELIARGWLHG
jgi:predicted ATPase